MPELCGQEKPVTHCKILVVILIFGSATTFAGQADWKADLAQAERLRVQGNFVPAAAMLEAVLREKATLSNLEVAVTLNNLALVYADQGRVYESEQCLLRSLALIEKLPGANLLIYSAAFNQLANLYFESSQKAKIDRRRLEGLRVSLEAAAPGSVDLALTDANLGSLYLLEKRYVDAELMFRKALEILRPMGNHARMASILGNLGVMKFEMGHRREAVADLEEALTHTEALAQPDPLITSTLLNNLASSQFQMNEQKRAMQSIERAVAMAEQAFGPDHPVLIEILLNYSAILKQAKRKPEARSAERRAHEIAARSARENHLDATVDVRSLTVLPRNR